MSESKYLPHDLFRRIRGRFLFYFVSGMMRVRFITGSYKRFNAGSCAVYGPSDFLKTASSAVNKLHDLDGALYESLSSKKFVFWYEPGGPMYFRRHGGIPTAYCKWQEYGILACMVYTYFTNECFYEGKRTRYEPDQIAALSREVYTRVRNWLEEKQFPGQLISCFNLQNAESGPAANA